MNTNIVNVKYEDQYNEKTFSGKEYSYFTEIKLSIGDIVKAPTQYGLKIARVSKINIPEEKIINIKPYMRVITKKIDKEKYLRDSSEYGVAA